MIKSFKHKGLKVFFETGSSRGINSQHANKIKRLLAALNRAIKPEDVNMPGWNLHPLSGNLKERWSIKVSGNWRITFIFVGTDTELVDYQDYQDYH